MTRIELIRRNAEAIRALHAKIGEEFEKAPHSPEHRSASAAFDDNYDPLAFPGGLEYGLARLKDGDPWAIEAAIDFLDADGWFFRSGYIKEEVLKRLKTSPLTDAQRERLTNLVLHNVSTATERVFKGYVRLASTLQSETLTRELKSLANTTDSKERRRAARLLAVIQSERKGQCKRR